ncbi:MAG: hypothetical protein ACJATY_000873, partial [Spirosomataceae bacterium]
RKMMDHAFNNLDETEDIMQDNLRDLKV